MELKTNKVVLIVIGIIIAYLLIVYLPKQQELKSRQQENTLIQQETSLRKQVYELCVKEIDESGKTVGDYLKWQLNTNQITQQEFLGGLALFASKRDESVTNCIEKRLQDYNR